MFDLGHLAANPAVAMTFKLGALTLIGLYLLFLLVIFKQIRSMNTIISQPDLFPILRTSALILIGLNVFIFLLGIVIL